MKARFYLMLALAIAIPAGGSVVRADTADECFHRTSDLGNIPTVSATSASCDTSGAFDLSAEWVTPGNGLGPSFGAASAYADFYKQIDAGGLTEFDLHVSVDIDYARALAETAVIGDVVSGQGASTGIEIQVDDCGGCGARRGHLNRSIAYTNQGEVIRANDRTTYVVPARDVSALPVGGAITVRISLSAHANGIYTPGRSEADLSGTITNVSVEPAALPSYPACERATWTGSTPGATATATCDAAHRTFETALRAPAATGSIPAVDSTIMWAGSVSLAGGSDFAVLEVPYTITHASYYAPGSGTADLWPMPQSSLDVRYRGPSKQGGSNGITVVDAQRDEVVTGSRTLRFMIAAPEGEVLTAGVYEVTVSLRSDLNIADRMQYPDEPLELRVAGSIGTLRFIQ